MKLSNFLTVAPAAAALYKRDETTTATVPGSTLITSVPGAESEIAVEGTTESVVVDGTTTVWTADSEGATTQIVVSGTTTTLEFSGTSAEFTLTEPTSVVLSIDDISTDIVFGDASTAVVIPGVTTTVEVTGSTVATLQLASTSVEVNFAGSTFDFSSTDGTTEFTASIDGTTAELIVAGTTSTITLDGTEVTLSVDGTEVTLTATSTEESSSEESSSSESTTEESSSTSEESTTESTTEESSTSEESTTEATTESTTSMPYANSTVAQPTSYPTYCEVVRAPLTPEEEVQLKVLFSDREGASAFADYVVSYASKLVSEIDSVANVAVGDNDYAFTTAFENVDYTGILGLASAAPIYTCFLSSLWAEALSNPQKYAKRAVPTQDEKTKLIVLFEKRENNGMAFDYAELLVDETNDLIAEIQSVSAAAANGDLAAYASLFANVDVPYFLSIASEAPIYTEGLSAAFESALSSFNATRTAPVTVNVTTATTTSINTFVTNYVNGTVTVPTTVVATQTMVVVCDDICRTYTIVVSCDVVCTTETLYGGASPRPNTVQTRTVTAQAAETTRRPNVAVYTQVEHGVTYTHTIEIQTRNGAIKKVAALGAGIFGVLAMLM